MGVTVFILACFFGALIGNIIDNKDRVCEEQYEECEESQISEMD